MYKSKASDQISPGLVFFLIYLFLVYVRPYEMAGLRFLIPLQPTRIFMLLAMFFSLLNRDWTSDVFKNSAVKWYIMIPLLAVALLPFSVWKARSLDFFKATDLRIMATFFTLLVFLKSDYKIRLINRIVFFSFVCVALRVFMAYKAGHYIVDAGVQRVVGVGTLGSDDPNDMALVLAMAVPFGLYYWHAAKGLKKLLAGFSLFLILSALVVTGSRGGYLGVSAGALVFYGFLYRKKKLKYILAMTFFVLTAIFVMPPQYKSRFLSMFDKSDYTHADERHGRIGVWKRSWKAMLKRPVGYGRGNTTVAEGMQKGSEGMQGKWMVTHNSYLQIGLELGFLGLFCYLMFLFSGFANIKKTLGMCRGPDMRNYEVYACALAGGLSAFLVSSMFLSQAYYWNQYIFIALTVGLRRVAENQKEEGRGKKEEKSKKFSGNRGAGQPGHSKKWKSRALSGQLRKTQDS